MEFFMISVALILILLNLLLALRSDKLKRKLVHLLIAFILITWLCYVLDQKEIHKIFYKFIEN